MNKWGGNKLKEITMARIGNEAKLILKLAANRAETKVTQVYKDNKNGDYYAGWRNAINWYREELHQIINELEQG